jgi:hypothetical protein
MPSAELSTCRADPIGEFSDEGVCRDCFPTARCCNDGSSRHVRRLIRVFLGTRRRGPWHLRPAQCSLNASRCFASLFPGQQVLPQPTDLESQATCLTAHMARSRLGSLSPRPDGIWLEDDDFGCRESQQLARTCGASSFRDLPQLGEGGGAIGAVVSSAHDPERTLGRFWP